MINQIKNWKQDNHWKKETLAQGYKACAALPLRDQNGVFGVLSVCMNLDDTFLNREVILLDELAGDIAFGIQTIRTRHERDAIRIRLNQTLLQTVQAIATTVEKRDPYTAGHQQRVSELAVCIAKEIGLDEQQIEGIRLGSAIHDIGKIYIPVEILGRPGKLSKHEFELIKTHPQVGFDIIKDVEFPWPIREMVLQHHERLNGSGYPKGLLADDIILESRILAVADVVESINANRPYRPSLGIEVAVNEIRKGAGQLYDPLIVSACIQLIEDNKLPWS